MKYCLKLLLLIFSIPFYGQSYHSPITQYIHLDQIESINRNIEINSERILIATNTPDKEHLQTFKILNIEERKIVNIGLSTIYNCTSLDGKFKTQIIVPKIYPIEFIDAIQPFQLGDTKRHYRFLLDADSNKLM